MTAKFKPGPEQPARDVASEFERKFSVGSYLAHQGERFVERFDANSYMTLSMAMDLFDLGDSRQALQRSFVGADCRFLVVSFSSDWLFPPFQSRQVVEALIPMGRRISYCEVRSDCGHDAFLLQDDVAIYGELVRGFLEPVWDHQPDPALQAHPASLFRGDRLDYEHITALVPRGSSVLDLACGSGELLHRLRAAGHANLMGVELSERAIVDCTRRGLSVVHANIDEGLGAFADGQFDVVVLSQTLQAVGDVQRVLREMLRVGRRSIVSFPNAAHDGNRRRLAEDGRAPETAFTGAHRWYDPPPLRLFSILDFEELCASLDLQVERRVALDLKQGREVRVDVNRTADFAIFVLSEG
jgi:homoserine O-acetyltransferase